MKLEQEVGRKDVQNNFLFSPCSPISPRLALWLLANAETVPRWLAMICG